MHNSLQPEHVRALQAERLRNHRPPRRDAAGDARRWARWIAVIRLPRIRIVVTKKAT